MKIRAREETDLAATVSLADAVRAVDRWPPHRVGSTREFIRSGTPLATFVADEDGALVGHVAVHERSAGDVMTLASTALGIEVDGLGVIARLFVDPLRRSSGVGARLLRASVDATVSAGRHPILDVWEELDHAIALYEREGWERLGDVTFTFARPCGPDCLHAGNSLRSLVYSAPVP